MRVLSAGVLRPGVNLGHICTAHPRVLGSARACSPMAVEGIVGRRRGVRRF